MIDLSEIGSELDNIIVLNKQLNAVLYFVRAPLDIIYAYEIQSKQPTFNAFIVSVSLFIFILQNQFIKLKKASLVCFYLTIRFN